MSPIPGTHSGQIDALRSTTQPGTGVHTALETLDSESIVLVRGSWEACQRLWNVLSSGEITPLACWRSLLSSGAPVALGTGQP